MTFTSDVLVGRTSAGQRQTVKQQGTCALTARTHVNPICLNTCHNYTFTM